MINRICNTQNNSNISFRGKLVSFDTAMSYVNPIKNSGAKRIGLFGHSSLDNDAECSKHTFQSILKKLGIKTYIYSRKEQVRGLFLENSKKIKKITKQPDLIITLDFNDERRIPKLFSDIFKNNKPGNIIGIDHHKDTKTMQGNFYIDDTAKSCCGIVFRFAEALGVKLGKKDYKNLYCGMLSDYQKSSLIKFENGKLIKTPRLLEDANSLEVLEKVEKQVSEENKIKIYKHLDILSNLTPKEKKFREKLSSMVRTSPNGKLAYVAIDPNDKKWRELGMDNDRTSAIIRELRLRLVHGVENDNLFTPEQKEKLKNVKAAMVFYRTSPKSHGTYQMSIHSKEGFTQKILNYIKTNINPKFEGDGHEDRAGGRIRTMDRAEIVKFINSFIEAAQKVEQ